MLTRRHPSHAPAPEDTTPETSDASVWQYLWTGLSAGFLALVLGLGVLVIGLPAAVGGMPLTVLSGSMEPTYSPGDLVVVRPTPAEEIRLGDVVTYQVRSGDPTRVTHRVVSRSVATDGTTAFVTQGDNSAAQDEAPVRDVQVVGTVWYSIPWLGWVNHSVSGSTRQWLLPAVAACLFLYAGWTAVSALRERAGPGVLPSARSRPRGDR
ncbi:signal peptidase I [Kocuria sp. M1R5S2]|uniref:signal peptidase I n=1 Tax=Kocuria rhizosphaerae TaxID=3376285 RepID=UPI0037B46078